MFADPQTKPGTVVKFNISKGNVPVWEDGVVVGPDPKNSANIVIKARGVEWVTHWGNTKLD